MVTLLLVLLHHGPRGDFFGAVTVAAGFLGFFFDVLKLALLFLAMIIDRIAFA